MYWQEDDTKGDAGDAVNVVDLHFKIDCKQIPTSHAWALSRALYQTLPWIRDEAEVGIHQIHGATSGNGWQRPPDGELIYLSKRTRMHLRVPAARIDDAAELVGKKLLVAGCPVNVGAMQVKKINPFSTLFCRYVVQSHGMSEDDFLRWVVDELSKRDLSVRKLLCGIAHEIEADGVRIKTRSLMVADLDNEASVALQEVGLGPHRHLGCGIFITHKGIKAVSDVKDEA